MSTSRLTVIRQERSPTNPLKWATRTLPQVVAVISYPPIPIFELGPLNLSLHGLFAALGFLFGAQLALRRAGRRGYDTAAFQSALTWGLVGAILGARYLTIGAHLDDYSSIWEALNPISGSFSIIGGFVGGIVAGAIRMRTLDLQILPLMDTATFGLALGTIVGRIGDLAIVEHLGGPTDSILGYGVRPGYDLAPQHDALECAVAEVGEFCGVYHHAAMYDMAGAVVLLVVLYWLVRVWPGRRYGQLFGFWIAWYGAQRFLIDFTRLALDVNGDATLGPFTWSQWAGLTGVAVGAAVILLLRRNPVVSTEEDARIAGKEPLAESDDPALR